MNQKKQIIYKLVELEMLLEKCGEVTEDTQIQFLADGLKALLHGGQSPQSANLFMYHIQNYLKEYALITKQITFRQYLEDKMEILLN